ncbi:hypothetical protein FALCPG4_19030 [Fusarium falciforme]
MAPGAPATTVDISNVPRKQLPNIQGKAISRLAMNQFNTTPTPSSRNKRDAIVIKGDRVQHQSVRLVSVRNRRERACPAVTDPSDHTGEGVPPLLDLLPDGPRPRWESPLRGARVCRRGWRRPQAARDPVLLLHRQGRRRHQDHPRHDPDDRTPARLHPGRLCPPTRPLCRPADRPAGALAGAGRGLPRRPEPRPLQPLCQVICGQRELEPGAHPLPLLGLHLHQGLPEQPMRQLHLAEGHHLRVGEAARLPGNVGHRGAPELAAAGQGVSGAATGLVRG